MPLSSGIAGGISAIAPFTGPAAPFVAAGAQLVTLVAKLFGIAPRGNFQKFGRLFYPTLATEAQQTGLPVHFYWFGDLIEVRSDGTFGVIFNGTIPVVEAYEFEQVKAGAHFLKPIVPPDFDINDGPGRFSGWQELGSAPILGSLLGGPGGASGGGNLMGLLLLAAVVFGVWFIFK